MPSKSEKEPKRKSTLQKKQHREEEEDEQEIEQEENDEEELDEEEDDDDDESDSEDSDSLSETSFSSSYCSDPDCEECKETKPSPKKAPKKAPAQTPAVDPLKELLKKLPDGQNYSILQRSLIALNDEINRSTNYTKITNMYNYIIETQKSELFSKYEIDMLKAVYEKERSDMVNSVQKHRPLLEQCKTLWENKKNWLAKLCDLNMIPAQFQAQFLKGLDAEQNAIWALEKRIKQ